MGMCEKLIELLDETFEKQYVKNLVITAWSTANHLITNGVTIPVRCEDCKKRYKPNECPMCILVYSEQHDFTQENGYCDRGERRTDDERAG